MTSEPTQTDAAATRRPLLWAAPILIVLLGFWLAWDVPTYQPADELSHSCRAWQVAHGGLVAEKGGVDEAGVQMPSGGQVPASFLAVERPMKDYYFRYNKPVPDGVIAAQAAVPLEPQDTVFYNFANTAVYAPTAYVQYLPGAWIGRILKLGPVNLVRAMRISGLLLAALAVWWILRVAPGYHELLFLYLAIPTAVGLYASISADVVMLLCLTGWIVWCLHLRLRGDDTMSRRDWWITLLLAASLPFGKFPYAPMILLWLLTPQAWGGGNMPRWGRTAIVWGVSIAAFLLVAGVFLPYSRSGYSDMSVGDQVRYCLEHPTAFPVAIWNALREKGISIAIGMIGGFGHADTYIHFGWNLLFMVGLSLGVLTSASPIAWTRRDRVVLLAASGICLTAVFFFLYVAWSSVGASSVNGVTGRYVLPAVLPLLLACTNRQYSDSAPRRTAWLLVGLMSLLAFAAAHAVHARYHG